VSGDEAGRLCVWDTGSGLELARAEFSAPIQAAAFFGDGSIVVGLGIGSGLTEGEGSLRWLDPSSGDIRRTVPTHGNVSALALHPDYAQLVFADSAHRVVWVSDGEPVVLADQFKGPIRALAWCGEHIMVGAGRVGTDACLTVLSARLEQ